MQWTFTFLSIALSFQISLFGQSENRHVWSQQSSHTNASLRGLSIVDDATVWASGTNGTVLRTVDGGETWQLLQIDEPGTGRVDIDFRDVHAFDADNAVVMGIASPARFFRTKDAGKTWTECFRDERPDIFFDAISFWDKRNGIAFADPIDGKLIIAKTGDGGSSWQLVDPSRLPDALTGEGGFAASGSCLTTRGKQLAWIALGGQPGAGDKPNARVLYTDDGGKTWAATITPIKRSASAGIFSLAFSDDAHGVAVGGDYQKAEDRSSNVALTRDGGLSWQRPTGKVPSGYRSAVAVAKKGDQLVFVAVGPTGTDISTDGGNAWTEIDDGSFHAVAFTNDGRSGWAVGADGRIGKWVFPE